MTALSCWLLGGTACPVEPTCEGVRPEDGRLELGQGREAMTSLGEGATLQVERGSQGGMHVWASLWAEGIAPGPDDLWAGLRDGNLPLVGFVLSSDLGVHTPDNERRSVLERSGSGYEIVGSLVVFEHFPELPDNWTDLDYAEVEAEMEERDHQLLVSLQDACGTTLTDSRTVRLSFPPRPGDDDEG